MEAQDEEMVVETAQDESIEPYSEKAGRTGQDAEEASTAEISAENTIENTALPPAVFVNEELSR